MESAADDSDEERRAGSERTGPGSGSPSLAGRKSQSRQASRPPRPAVPAVTIELRLAGIRRWQSSHLWPILTSESRQGEARSISERKLEEQNTHQVERDFTKMNAVE